MTVSIVSAMAATNQLAVVYQAKRVLYQCASIDITHCQMRAALVKAPMGRKVADQ